MHSFRGLKPKYQGPMRGHFLFQGEIVINEPKIATLDDRGRPVCPLCRMVCDAPEKSGDVYTCTLKDSYQLVCGGRFVLPQEARPPRLFA
jgi:hypothetical protein